MSWFFPPIYLIPPNHPTQLFTVHFPRYILQGRQRREARVGVVFDQEEDIARVVLLDRIRIAEQNSNRLAVICFFVVFVALLIFFFSRSFPYEPSCQELCRDFSQLAQLGEGDGSALLSLKESCLGRRF